MAAALSQLGVLHRIAGNLPEAEQGLRESLEIRRSRFEANHTDVTRAAEKLERVLALMEG